MVWRIIIFIILLNLDVVFAGNNTDISNNVTSSNVTSNTLSEIFKIYPDKDFKWEEHRDILPKKYAQIIEQPAPVYGVPWMDLSNKKPKRLIDGGFIWVSLESPVGIKSGNCTWYQINDQEFMQEKYMAFYEPSTFKGIDLRQKELDGLFGWLVLDTYTSLTPGKQDYLEGELIEKHTLVKILATILINGKKWLKLAEKKWVDGTRVALITSAQRPNKIPPGANWIDINIYEQVLCAYEGDKMIYATLISSGLPSFDTPSGVFRIWGKAKMRKMSGGEKGKDYYFLEDVPYQMYFSHGVAIHAAYWHNNFGIRQSHGCVNVSPRDAKWLFEWTSPKVISKSFIKSTRSNPGTFVYVH